jgi:hypothetical protein
MSCRSIPTTRAILFRDRAGPPFNIDPVRCKPATVFEHVRASQPGKAWRSAEVSRSSVGGTQTSTAARRRESFLVLHSLSLKPRQDPVGAFAIWMKPIAQVKGG